MLVTGLYLDARQPRATSASTRPTARTSPVTSYFKMVDLQLVLIGMYRAALFGYGRADLIRLLDATGVQ